MIALDNAGLKRGDRWIFRGIDLRLDTGRCLAILGPNGRGKTTLIKALAGLLALDEGRHTVPARIGYVSQSLAAGIPYRCIDMVVMGRIARLGLFGAPGKADYRAAHDALERVGAAAFAERAFDELSGGERQIVMLARALATGSPVLILDEPASALDLANQSLLLSVLKRLKAEASHAIVFSTHLPQHAIHIADDALLMLDDLAYLHGPAATVMNEVNLEALYGVPVRRVSVAYGEQTTVEAVVPIFL